MLKQSQEIESKSQSFPRNRRIFERTKTYLSLFLEEDNTGVQFTTKHQKGTSYNPQLYKIYTGYRIHLQIYTHTNDVIMINLSKITSQGIKRGPHTSRIE